MFDFGGFALYQVITTVFCLAMIFKGVSGYKRHERTLREFVIWIFVWGIIGSFAFFPRVIDSVAVLLGIKSGSVGFLAAWLIFLTYAFFKIFMIMEDLDRKITDLTRKEAFDSFEKDKNSSKKADDTKTAEK